MTVDLFDMQIEDSPLYHKPLPRWKRERAWFEVMGISIAVVIGVISVWYFSRLFSDFEYDAPPVILLIVPLVVIGLAIQPTIRYLYNRDNVYLIVHDAEHEDILKTISTELRTNGIEFALKDHGVVGFNGSTHKAARYELDKFACSLRVMKRSSREDSPVHILVAIGPVTRANVEDARRTTSMVTEALLRRYSPKPDDDDRLHHLYPRY